MNAPSPRSEHDVLALRLTFASISGSLVVAVCLLGAYVVFGSQLALAQAVDSFSDMLAGAALVWAVRQSAQPADDDHPLGHDRAEPLAALVVAVLAGVLSFEVLRGAVTALLTGQEAQLEWPVALAFGAKVAFKSVIAALATAAVRRRANPALDALRVDARNDVLVSSVALVGYALARFGFPQADAALAIVLAVYVAFAGLRLARENVDLLMGGAAPVERRAELVDLARSVQGVREVESLVATWSGSSLHVHIEIAVDRELTLLLAHEIGHAVEARLGAEDDVARVVAHVGPQGG